MRRESPPGDRTPDTAFEPGSRSGRRRCRRPTVGLRAACRTFGLRHAPPGSRRIDRSEIACVRPLVSGMPRVLASPAPRTHTGPASPSSVSRFRSGPSRTGTYARRVPPRPLAHPRAPSSHRMQQQHSMQKVRPMRRRAVLSNDASQYTACCPAGARTLGPTRFRTDSWRRRGHSVRARTGGMEDCRCTKRDRPGRRPSGRLSAPVCSETLRNGFPGHCRGTEAPVMCPRARPKS
jgi:hypothetical protein